jgi:predicted DNA-binding transcriptional regulator AlpA
MNTLFMKLPEYSHIEPHRTQTMPEQPQVPAKYIKMHEVEPIYGIGRTKLYYLMREGKIRAIKLGHRNTKQIRVLIDVESLEAYLNGLPAHVIPSLEEKHEP